ncbi:MAG TPA: tail fiber domain-containing protein [Chryseosolibacter sp.]|nr:tail fiber domain-containing protein [Chryseosolibacter sp.]
MDERLIEKIHGYKKGLEVLKELKPVTYNKKGSDKKDVGLIAQDVQELEPLAIGKNSAGLLVPRFCRYSLKMTL